VKAEADALAAALAGHDQRYYNQGAPDISDQEYDALKRRLTALRAALSAAGGGGDSAAGALGAAGPAGAVGAPPPAGSPLRKVRHELPMLSLAAVNSEAELFTWHARLATLSREAAAGAFVVEPKVDGVALTLRYERGVLSQAATRGDGAIGEEVPAAAAVIAGVRPRLASLAAAPPVVHVRGEVFISLEDFAALSAGEAPPFANARNAAAGSLRLLDPAVAATRRLRFVAYAALEPEGGGGAPSLPASHHERLAWLAAQGLPVVADARRCGSFEEALAEAARWRATRGALGFEADGVVLKVDDTRLHAALGAVGGDPRRGGGGSGGSEEASGRRAARQCVFSSAASAECRRPNPHPG